MENRAKNTGFAAMDGLKQREIARQGGRAAHRKGTAHEFSAEEARNAGRKGGQRVAANRSHMSEIGKLGGRRSAEQRRKRLAAANEKVPAKSHGEKESVSGSEVPELNKASSQSDADV